MLWFLTPQSSWWLLLLGGTTAPIYRVGMDMAGSWEMLVTIYQTRVSRLTTQHRKVAVQWKLWFHMPVILTTWNLQVHIQHFSCTVWPWRWRPCEPFETSGTVYPGLYITTPEDMNLNNATWWTSDLIVYSVIFIYSLCDCKWNKVCNLFQYQHNKTTTTMTNGLHLDPKMTKNN